MKIITLPLIATLILFAHPVCALTESEKSQAVSETQKVLASAKPRADIRPTTYRDITGLEWLQISMGARRDAILVSMAVLDQHGVLLSRSLLDYYDAIEQKLRSNPDLYDVNLTDILASFVYETEPESRGVLNQFMKKKPEIKKIEMH